MSWSLKGVFCPTILPLFHGSREVALPAVPMMVSHRVGGLHRMRSRVGRANCCADGQLPGAPANSQSRPEANIQERRCRPWHRECSKWTEAA
jgi:hypothetical protein